MTVIDQRREPGFRPYPGRFALLFNKMPMLLWRLGLRPILGRTFVLITTTGRKSGQPRRAMVGYYVVNGKKYVYSGYGQQSQWYKNIAANPRMTIQNAHGTEQVTARRVTDLDELVEVFRQILDKHPRLAKSFVTMLGFEPTAQNIAAYKDQMILLTFEPAGESQPGS